MDNPVHQQQYKWWYSKGKKSVNNLATHQQLKEDIGVRF
jgi:hypothetical protein